MTSPNRSMNFVTTSERMREPDAAAKRSERPLYVAKTSSGRSTMRSNMTGTTHNPVARCSSTNARVASGSNLRRVTMVQAISAAMPNCPNPQAWNMGATITVVCSARHGVRSRIDFNAFALPPECLAPLGDPVVPDVSRIVFDVRVACNGRRPRCPSTKPATVTSCAPGSSVHATIRAACGRSLHAWSIDDANSSSKMTASTCSRATTSAKAGPAKDVFNSRTSAPIRLAATNGTTKPRWLRAVMPTTFGGPPGNVCSAAAKASPSSSSSRHVRVPNSSISPGRSGHRWAAIANPEVAFIPARRTAAAMRAYRSGRSGAISLARDIVPMRPAICFSRSSMSAPPVGKFSSPSTSARCQPLITGPDQTHQPFGHVWVPLRDGRRLQLRRVHVVPSAEIVKQFDVIDPGDGVPEYLETDAGSGGVLKRLGGWDAVLLYNETPNLPH